MQASEIMPLILVDPRQSESVESLFKLQAHGTVPLIIEEPNKLLASLKKSKPFLPVDDPKPHDKEPFYMGLPKYRRKRPNA
jgi:hypothetical protein